MKVGDKVRKVGGTYQGEWEIRAVFFTRSGEVRIVAESLVLRGLLHIFNQSQLEAIDE